MKNTAMRLKGKVALVTGAGRGIGRAVALAFAAEGARVALLARTKSELEDVARAAAAHGVKALAVRCDLTKPGQVKAALAKVKRAFKRVDVLVDNAGVLGPRGLLVKVTDHEFETVLDVNVTGTFRLTRGVLLDFMLPAKRGCVIMVSSTLGRKGRAEWGPYAVSKFGIEALVQVWADEIPGIRFYSLNPLATRTSMRADAFPEEDPATLKSAESVGPAFVELAADSCRIPSGSALTLERATGRLELPA